MDRERIGREGAASIIVKAFYEVYNEMGYGFLEKNYENALAFELRSRGLFLKQQFPIQVFYKSQHIGDYFADMVVEDHILCELKAVEHLTLEHEAQLLNYLKAIEFEMGFLLNFGKKPEIKRRLFDNSRK